MFPYIDHFVIGVADKPPLLQHMPTRQSSLKHGARKKRRLTYTSRNSTIRRGEIIDVRRVCEAVALAILVYHIVN